MPEVIEIGVPIEEIAARQARGRTKRFEEPDRVPRVAGHQPATCCRPSASGSGITTPTRRPCCGRRFSARSG